MCVLRPFNSRADFVLSGGACLVGAVWGVVALVPDPEAAVVLALIGVWLSALALGLLVLQMLLTPRAARGLRRIHSLMRMVLGSQSNAVARTKRNQHQGPAKLVHPRPREAQLRPSPRDGCRVALELPPGARGNLAFLVMIAAGGSMDGRSGD